MFPKSLVFTQSELFKVCIWVRGHSPSSACLRYPFRVLQTPGILSRLRHSLLDIEEKALQKMKTMKCEETDEIGLARLKEVWKEQKRLVRNEVKRELSEICCVRNEMCEPAEIAKVLRCCILEARTSHGRDVETQNHDYSLQNHKDMISDAVRVKAFWEAIARAVSKKSVLDVGTGAFCFLSRMALAAGARDVHAIEVNQNAWHHAVDLLSAEIRGESCAEIRCVQEFPLIGIGTQVSEELESEIYKVTLATPEACDVQCLLLHPVDAFKLEAPLRTTRPVRPSDPLRSLSQVTQRTSVTPVTPKTPYDVVIHELLGHIASSEGVCETMAALCARPLCSVRTQFIPRAAGTLFAPTEALQLTQLEEAGPGTGKAGCKQAVAFSIVFVWATAL